MKQFFIGLLFISTTTMAQQKDVKDWHLLDYEADGYRGISLQKAYDLLKGKKSEKVIVAVIDSGIDTAHADIPFWKNPKEIPNNNIDDDGNGLVDDYHGWNYLGAANGENLSISINDYWRTYHRFKKQFAVIDSTTLDSTTKFIYSEWLRAKNHVEAKCTFAKGKIEEVTETLNTIKQLNIEAKKIVKKDEFTVTDVQGTNNSVLKEWENIFNGRGFTNTFFQKQYEQYVAELEEDIKQKDTEPVPVRDTLLNDDGYDISKTHYGNTNLKSFCGNHGTSVSSIIGGIRNNGIGVDGIADNVEIIMIRGILGKDEFDKDVALSIRYAVDHGAKVINMSFGKYISPDKRWVDAAIAYALSKDVLLVHASGNDGENIDLNYNYPNAFAIDGKKFANFINVSASGDTHTGGIVPFFTNYGTKMVDIFAPGVGINCATTIGGTQLASGTSMAAPIVAGIAALLRSYFPKLTAVQVVDIILKSGVKMKDKVALPSSTETIPFSFLSKTGSITNAYNAVKMAMGVK